LEAHKELGSYLDINWRMQRIAAEVFKGCINTIGLMTRLFTESNSLPPQSTQLSLESSVSGKREIPGLRFGIQHIHLLCANGSYLIVIAPGRDH
jgi:hypothetical protein